MVGIKRFKFLLGIIIPIFGFFLMSQNTFAASLSTAQFGLYYKSSDSAAWQQKQGILYGAYNNNDTQFNYGGYIRDYYWLTPVVQFNGNSVAIHFETNLVASLYRNTGSPWVNLDHLAISNCGSYTIANSSLSYAVTPWTSNGRYNYTLTVYGDVVFSGVNKTQDDIRCTVSGVDYSFFDGPYDANATSVYFEQNPMTINFSNNINDALLQAQINQSNTIINQNQAVMDQNNSAYDAISGQSENNISGATNGQTTSLINVISGFISAFSGISASNCNMTLEFPTYAGGTRVVNICSGKEKGPRIVEIGSSLLLILVFVPLAYILIRMIYNEIRSWTNG